MARRVVRLHLQVEGRHRSARRRAPITRNVIWGGYSDYYGFGTDEFLGLCRKLDSEPLIVLPAPGTGPEQVQYAMDWVHYLNDPPTTEWGAMRAPNGHPEPYGVRYFQIDNEPMNNGFTAERTPKSSTSMAAGCGRSRPGRASSRADRSARTT